MLLVAALAGLSGVAAIVASAYALTNIEVGAELTPQQDKALLAADEVAALLGERSTEVTSADQGNLLGAAYAERHISGRALKAVHRVQHWEWERAQGSAATLFAESAQADIISHVQGVLPSAVVVMQDVNEGLRVLTFERGAEPFGVVVWRAEAAHTSMVWVARADAALPEEAQSRLTEIAERGMSAWADEHD